MSLTFPLTNYTNFLLYYNIMLKCYWHLLLNPFVETARFFTFGVNKIFCRGIQEVENKDIRPFIKNVLLEWASGNTWMFIICWNRGWTVVLGFVGSNRDRDSKPRDSQDKNPAQSQDGPAVPEFYGTIISRRQAGPGQKIAGMSRPVPCPSLVKI